MRKKAIVTLLVLTTTVLVFGQEMKKSKPRLIPDYIQFEGGEGKVELNVLGYEKSERIELLKSARKTKAWVAISGKVFEVSITSATLGELPENPGIYWGLEVRFRSNEPIDVDGDFGVFSFDPIPNQTCKYLKNDVVQTVQGDFRLRLSPVNNDAEFLEYEIEVQRRLADGKWESIDHFTDQGASWVADFDGDGVPEICGPTGYKDRVLRRVWPEFESVMLNPSGL